MLQLTVTYLPHNSASKTLSILIEGYPSCKNQLYKSQSFTSG